MTAPIKLETGDTQFPNQYDPERMRRLQQQLNSVTRLNQKLVQMLQGGNPGQVLKKTGPGDFEASWQDP